MNRIEHQYNASIYSYQCTYDQVNSGKFDPDLNNFEVLSESDSEKKDIFRSYKKLKATYKNKLPKELSELIFVRVISILEVFLISQVRELFLLRKDLFHSEEKIGVVRGELLNTNSITELWSKLIERELRKLQNQSLKDKAKYFRKYLGIEFSRSPSYPAPLEVIHDKRHLIVHRLGKTDLQFRKKYGLEVRTIQIAKEDLNDAFSNVRAFGAFIFENAERLVTDGTCIKHNYEAALTVKILKAGVENVFDNDFKFIDDDKLVWCSDFIETTSRSESEVTVVMKGDKSLITSYIRLIRKLHNGRSIQIIEIYNNPNPISLQGRKLSNGEIAELATHMPERPWRKDIHKRIAVIKGTSNSVISKALKGILDNPELVSRIGEKPKFE